MHEFDPTFGERPTNHAPLKRLVTGGEIANIIALLCIPAFDAMTEPRSRVSETSRASEIEGDALNYQFKEGLAYVNGEFIPSSRAVVSIYDSALMFGDMVFEFTRSFRHKPFRLREHLERLYASMKVCRIDPGMSIDQMERKTLEVIDKNIDLYPEELDYHLLHEVSRGIDGLYRRLFDGNSEPCVVIDMYPLDLHQAVMAPFYDSGVHVVIPRQMSIPARFLDPKMKNRRNDNFSIFKLNKINIFPHFKHICN